MKRPLFLVWLTTIALLASTAAPPSGHAAGWWGSDKKSKTHKDKDDDETGDLDEYDARAKVPLVGEMTQIVGGYWIQLEGAGLVVDLNGTGEDPPPSEARHAVLEDMKRRGIPNPNKILKMPNVTVVIVTGYVPALIRKGEHFDFEVRLPDGSKVKSLNGGRLMTCYLREHLPVAGTDHTSHEFAVAEGPVLVGSSYKSTSDQAGMMRRGRVVAGGTWKWEDRFLGRVSEKRLPQRAQRNPYRRGDRTAVLRLRQTWPAGSAGRSQDRSEDRAQGDAQVPRQLSALPRSRPQNCVPRNRRRPSGANPGTQVGPARPRNCGPSRPQTGGDRRAGHSDAEDRAQEQ